ncbi:plasmid maintenance system toxin protein HigB (plasmid) [Vibrio vulnificus]|uniref:type II toxin-antitoxin system RelE/ParE family toxin n=1 Tax=Vibrio vulnificus TaxID=672 RepID=UPI0004F6EA2B|nr:type II toxin-antitoxin system RelE/ParE family toxin [Vibrio vulnificus]AIL73611.1 plasmid maintenance system toxin protein HigB [Vibrio vulnificus]
MAIKTFTHKGLEKFYYNGDTSGINPKHDSKLGRILDAIESSHHPKDLKAIYQHRFSQKKGAAKGVFSIEVNGNWRVTFEITDDGAIFLDYLDYHGKNITSRS